MSIFNKNHVEVKNGMIVYGQGETNQVEEEFVVVSHDRDRKVFSLNWKGNESYEPPQSFIDRPYKELINHNGRVLWNQDW